MEQCFRAWRKKKIKMKEVFMRHDKTNVLDTKHTVVKHTFVYAKCLIKFVYDIELSHEAFLF